MVLESLIIACSEITHPEIAGGRNVLCPHASPTPPHEGRRGRGRALAAWRPVCEVSGYSQRDPAGLTQERAFEASSGLQFNSVQSLGHVRLFATPWIAVFQASLSITNSRSLLTLMSIESVVPSNSCFVIPFSSCLQTFPASGFFPVSQFFPSDGQCIGVSASASVLPMNTQDSFLLEWTGLICL